MGQTILVTGGAGYIGSQTCKLLAAAGHRPVCYDDFSTGRRDFVRFGPLLEADIRDRDRLAEAFATYKPDQVMHFAARIEVEESTRRPTLYYDVNVAGTVALLTACLEHSVHQFTFSSTAAVYGEPGKSPVGLDADLKPINPYGASKLMAEQMLADAARETRMGITTFRYFNAAGADPEADIGGPFEGDSHILPRLILAAAQGRTFSVYGADYATRDGTCIRDYIHVHDVAAAHVSAVDAPTDAGKARFFNIGTGRGFSVRELIDAVESVTGRSINTEICPRRAGDPAELVADDTGITEQTFNWRACYGDLDDIVRHMWNWYRLEHKKDAS